MAPETYEILSLFMRYVFALMGFIILWRAYRWLRKDQRYYRSEMKRLPDAGFVGEMVDLDSEQVFPLPREGVIGSGRQADIIVNGRGARRRMADLTFVEGKGLRIEPLCRGQFYLDGEAFTRPVYALHGSVLRIQNTYFKVRLFAGLEVPERTAPVLPGPEEDAPDYDPFDGIAWTSYSYGGDEAPAGETDDGDDDVVWPGGRSGRDGNE